MLEVVDAMRRYHKAQASGCSELEIEWLRVLAGSLLQIIAEFNLQTLGDLSAQLHIL